MKEKLNEERRSYEKAGVVTLSEAVSRRLPRGGETCMLAAVQAVHSCDTC